MLGKNLIHKIAFIIPGLKKEIKKVVEKDRDSTLVLTDEGDNFMAFSTRENGNVGEEMSSQIDFDDAWRMSKKLLMEFTGKIKTDIEEVDEWVYLNITIL